MEEKQSSGRDWSKVGFVKKNLACYISQMKADNHNPSSHIIEGDEVHNISKTQFDPMVNDEDMVSKVSTFFSFLSSLNYWIF